MKRTLVIIGGGASGLMSAISAKSAVPGIAVILLERLDRVGKKLLATGNGRCNFTNTKLTLDNYCGEDTRFADAALSGFTVSDTIAFFERLGIVPRVENGGKVFPYSGAAASVLDALRSESERLGVKTVCGVTVKSILSADGGFLLLSDGEEYLADAVIVAGGGKASPSLGSDGSCLELMKSLGHSVSALTPALVQLKTPSDEVKALQGIKVVCAAYSLCNGRRVKSDAGEVLFTSYGLSGPPIFQLSSGCALGALDAIELDLTPEIEARDLEEMLVLRRKNLSHLTCEGFFTGFINKRVGNLIFRRCGVQKLSIPVNAITDRLTRDLAACIKSLRFDISGTNGWENAQVTAGGLRVNQFDPDTLMSRLHPGLFCAGEIFDIFGDCGGYNLQWAWSSGYLAGISAAVSIDNL